MGFGALGKIGVVLAIAVSVLVTYVIQNNKWDAKEPVLYNVMVYFVLPFMFPKTGPIMEKPLDLQVEHWDKFTAFNAKKSSNEFAVKMMGEAYHRASFGPTATRVTNFTVASVADIDHSIPVSCASPHDATSESKIPIVFYFFGGGLIIGNIECEFAIARWLAQEAEAVVCAIGYRLAPRYPYPAAINDAIDASVAVLEQKVVPSLESSLGTGINYQQIGTWGASAGGYMAAQTARQLTKRGYTLKCQISMIPMAKPNGGTQSILKNWNDVWSGAHNMYAWSSYLPGDDGTLARDWKVSLLVDPPEEVVEGLPPTFVEIHSRDVLHDEGEMYANRLRDQGKLIALVEYDVSHVGAIPSVAKGGGSAEGADVHAAKILKEYLNK